MNALQTVPNVPLTPPKRGDVSCPSSKRLANWGMPIAIRELDKIQQRHDELNSLHALHAAFCAASWYCGREYSPTTLGGEVGHALYFYNLPCGAKLAIWVPKGEDGKLAVYMSDTVSVQDLAKIQCDFVVTEITRFLAA